jgi:hypothetical protein
LSTRLSGSDLSMLAIVAQYRVGRRHLHHDSQRCRTEKDRLAEDPGACRGLEWARPATPMRYLPSAAMKAMRMKPAPIPMRN